MPWPQALKYMWIIITMAKKVSITLKDSRDRRDATLKDIVKKAEGAGFDGKPASVTSATGNPGTDNGNLLLQGDSPITFECVPPPPATTLDGTEGPDLIGPGRDVYERLTRVGDSFIPSQRCDFYRGVWFDGLEAYRPIHYTVDANKAIIPSATLIATTTVAARYVLR